MKNKLVPAAVLKPYKAYITDYTTYHLRVSVHYSAIDRVFVMCDTVSIMIDEKLYRMVY